MLRLRRQFVCKLRPLVFHDRAHLIRWRHHLAPGNARGDLARRRFTA
jgi:hypothetical protein